MNFSFLTLRALCSLRYIKKILMLKLYEYSPSGNSYKIRLLLTQLNITFEWLEIDILKGEIRTPEFLIKNPKGRIPV